MTKDASCFFTAADAVAGYPATRRRIAETSTPDLLWEYRYTVVSRLDVFRVAPDGLTGTAAKAFGNLLVEELHARHVLVSPDGLSITRFQY